MHRLVGPLAASNGFVVWIAFAMQSGGRMREAWDTDAYWVLGMPLLAMMHVLLGATLRRGTLWLPLCTIAGHLLGAALVHSPGAGLGLLPLVAAYVGLPLYAGLAIAGWAGHALAVLARRTA